MATVIQAYRFALDPTPRQRRAFASHCGAARYAYNWGLHLVRERLDRPRVDSSVQVPWTLGLDGLARALKNWANSKAGRRKAVRWASRTRRGRGAAGTPAGSPPDQCG